MKNSDEIPEVYDLFPLTMQAFKEDPSQFEEHFGAIWEPVPGSDTWNFGIYNGSEWVLGGLGCEDDFFVGVPTAQKEFMQICLNVSRSFFGGVRPVDVANAVSDAEDHWEDNPLKGEVIKVTRMPAEEERVDREVNAGDGQPDEPAQVQNESSEGANNGE